MSSLGSTALAEPAVFFNADQAAGEQTFINTINAADAAYNAANPGATQSSTIFRVDLTNTTGDVFSVTEGSVTVWVKTTRGGSPAMNDTNGDQGGDGFTNWGVSYTSGDFSSAEAAGYTVSFFSDSSLTSPYLVNAVGLNVSDWGTCCTNTGTLPDGSSASASQIYMLFNGDAPLLVGGISTAINPDEHFVAAINDTNDFASVTLVPNGIGEAFGAGGILTFSTVQLNSVPAGSSVVNIGGTPDIDTAAAYTVSELNSGNVNPVFDGGTLHVGSGGTVTANLSIKSTGGAIDTEGHDATFSGVISNDSSSPGALGKTGAGVLTLSGTNTYTGATTISGGVLALSGSGSIAQSSRVINDAGFDISATTSGASVTSLAGTGVVTLGGKTLTLSNASDSFSGAIGGEGGLTVAAGVETLSGTNTYTGDTTIASGATLRANGAGALSSASTIHVGGTLQLQNSAWSGAIDGAGGIVLGGGSLTTRGASDTRFSGVISGAGSLIKDGSGVLELTGTNTFTGGLGIAGGVVRTGSDASLGAGEVVIGGGALQASTGFSSAKAISVIDGASTFDTNGHDVALTGNLSGSGVLNKAGGGVLTLSGVNTQAGLNVRGGTVVASTQAAVGAAGGDITLGKDATFVTGSSMTLSQNLHVSGTNAVFDTGANDVTLTGSADGSQCLIKDGAGRLNLAANASNAVGACVQQGTLSFNGVFTGKVWVDADGTASGSGLILGDMEVRGTLAPGNSPGRLIVAGSVTQFAGSTFSPDIDGRAVGNGAGAYDTLVLTGAGSVYTAAGVIAPKLRGITGSATNTFTPKIGDLFQVVTAEGGVTGSYSSLAQPTSGLAPNSRFAVRYLPDAIVLAVTADSYAAVFAPGTMRNAARVGAAVDQFRGAAGLRDTSNAGVFADGLLGLDEAGLGRVLEQASGEVYADAVDSALQGARAVRGQVSERLNAGLDAGGLDKDPQLSRNLWGTVTADASHVGSDSSGQSYKVDGSAWVLGYDQAVLGHGVVGAALAYNQSQTRTGWLGTATTSGYQGMVYGQWAQAGFYANGLFAAGRQDYQVHRAVELTNGVRALRASPRGDNLGADLEVGRRFAFGLATVTPAAGLSYDNLQRDGFVETGDSVAALSLRENGRQALTARAGARLSAVLSSQGYRVTPYGSVFVTQELDELSSQIAPTLQGVTFLARAPGGARTGAQANLGVDVQMTRGLTLRAGYRYAGSSNASSNAATLGLSFRW